MVVAMIGMQVVEMAFDWIVDAISMRHRFLPTAGVVDMPAVMARVLTARNAGRRILRSDRKDMLDGGVVRIRIMKMSVVQIVDVTDMEHTRAAAESE
jgi:hypothetical protein